jgi:GNAT superfamily N-acetyltransferase
MLAEAGGEQAGHVAYVPARDEPDVAHVWMLFVRRQWWGTGLASDLLARAVASATEQGYAGMRLHTPAEHRRARSFYEREGWTLSSAPFYEPMLGLTLVTYRRRLEVSRSPGWRRAGSPSAPPR